MARKRETWYVCDEHGRDDCLVCAWRSGGVEATREAEVRVPREARAPDGYTHDDRPHRAFIMSRAMIREAVLAGYLYGIAITGKGFHGESKTLSAPAGRRLVMVEFERWWAAWRR